MSSSPALLFSFGAFCAAVWLVARWAGRRIGIPETAFFFLLTVGYLHPGFFSGRTILPADHAMLLAPWSHVGAGERYNANLNDAATQMAPWAKAVRIAWKEGSLPLRNRWNGAGMALAANGQSAPFSPFTILMLPFALWAGFTVQLAAKMFLALTGTFRAPPVCSGSRATTCAIAWGGGRTERSRPKRHPAPIWGLPPNLLRPRRAAPLLVSELHAPDKLILNVTY